MGKTKKTVQLEVSEELLEQIDHVKGFNTRSAKIFHLLKRGLVNE